MRNYTRWLFRLIGPVLLVIFLLTSDFSKLAESFSKIIWWPVLLSMALILPFLWIKSWRWNLLMRELGLQPPTLGYAMVLYTIGLFLGGTTPGQSGDFVKAWYLRNRGLPLPPVLFSIVLDRLFDFVIMAVLALLSLVTFIDAFPEQLRGSIQVATLLFAALILITTPMLMARRPREWMFGIVARFVPERFRPRFEQLREQIGSLSLRPVPLALLIGASALSAVATMIRIYLLYLALPLGNVPLLAIISSTALIAILQTLPISFSGIGVRDGVLIAVLAFYGYNAELAISLSALFLLLNIQHIIVGFLVSLRHPLETPPNVTDRVPS
jgi:uncharacterized protein (TIRG00374 family)